MVNDKNCRMNKIDKIVFFISSPFNQRDYSRFGIETLEKNGFDVEVWDFTPIVYPQVEGVVIPNDPVNYDKHHKFEYKKDFILAIGKLKNVFVINFCPYTPAALFIYRALSRFKIPYSVFMANAIPFGQKRELNIAWFYSKIKRITLNKLFNFIFPLIPSSYLGVHPATFILAGGEKSLIYKYPVSKKTEIIWLHTLDYDIYLEEKEYVETSNNTAVFLDEYLPFHEDYFFLSMTPYSTADKYYPALCNFFDYVEDKCDVELIIAAHPRSHYEQLPDYFNSRSVIRGDTINLVKKSRFVIAHASTSINFPVLLRKPIVFITTNELNNSPEGYAIRSFAGLLNKKTINIDEEYNIDWEKELCVDEQAYNNYINSYIKIKGSKEKPFWEIVAERLRNYDRK